MTVRFDSARRVASFDDFLNVICFDFTEVVLVGSAKVSLSDKDKEKINSMKAPMFVYFNHAVSSAQIQPYYPETFKEVLFVRGGGGGLYGVDLEGHAWFSPKSSASLAGVFLIHPPKDFIISSSTDVYIVSGELISSALVGYPENEAGKASPTTGYFAEAIFRGAMSSRTSKEEKSNPAPIYTIGFGLTGGSGQAIKNTSAHNMIFEYAQQKKKSLNGELLPVGTIIEAIVLVANRIMPSR